MPDFLLSTRGKFPSVSLGKGLFLEAAKNIVQIKEWNDYDFHTQGENFRKVAFMRNTGSKSPTDALGRRVLTEAAKNILAPLIIFWALFPTCSGTVVVKSYNKGSLVQRGHQISGTQLISEIWY